MAFTYEQVQKRARTVQKALPLLRAKIAREPTNVKAGRQLLRLERLARQKGLAVNPATKPIHTYRTTSRKTGKRYLHKVYHPARAFAPGAMRLGRGGASTFKTVTTKPGVRLVVGCLPGNVRKGVCARTTVQKKVTALNPKALHSSELDLARRMKVEGKSAVIVGFGAPLYVSAMQAGPVSRDLPGSRVWAIDAWIAELSKKAKNPSLLVMSNPRRKVRRVHGVAAGAVTRTAKAYQKFHMHPSTRQTKEWVPEGWPKTYMVIGYATRFDGMDLNGTKYSRRFASGRVRLCASGKMKDVYLFGPGLGVKSGWALRVDYDVPRDSGRNKWARSWYHPHDTRPSVIADSSGRAARITGAGLKVNERGIIG